MKLSLGLLVSSLVLSVAGLTDLEPRQFSNSSVLLAVPDCAARCSQLVAKNFLCDPATQKCICDQPQLEASLQACFIAICPPVEMYMSQAVFAGVCQRPVRDRSVVTGATTYTLYGIAAMFTIARFLSRNSLFGGAGYSWDDHTAFICFAASTAILGMLVKVQENGFGRDLYTLPDPNILENFLFWFYCVQPLYIVVTFISKVSMVLLYLRTWPSTLRSSFGMICWSAIGLLLTTFIASVFVTIFQCTPISYNWHDIGNSTSHCTDRVTQVYATASINIFYDIMVLSIPLAKLMDLDITFRQKAGIMFVFLVGIVVTVCSIVRLRYLSVFGASLNFTYDYSFLGLWSIVEVYTCIICVCMPAATGFFRRIHDWAAGPDADDDEHDLTESFDMEGHGHAEMAHELEDGSKFSSFAKGHADLEKANFKGASANRKSVTSPAPLLSLERNCARSDTAHSRIPELRYRDDENSIFLEVTHEPNSNEPVRAKLSYVDRQETLHTIEIEGKHPDAVIDQY
ncbi:uncharacterized protein RCC_11377 [Ramularia collo-cygni]|uniref:Uncharacterized protein n=1 Tax=Ramularia collo-cygni TaxID=112498 RepID=A0A2D3VC11_9PEZI|nr:uncharacterized protein RCC_11377 [Ramularia collo-cygni]CZT25708.1 uncharacterized protein RCC_11377 [Ramularia collo-cygni]